MRELLYLVDRFFNNGEKGAVFLYRHNSAFYLKKFAGKFSDLIIS